MAESGDLGLMQYSNWHYIFNKLSDAEVGEQGLLVPLSGYRYRVAELAKNANVGDVVTIVHDRKGNYYAIE